MSKIIYSWEFEDKKDRGPFWYTIALSVVIGLSVWGFFTKQYAMSFIVLLISGLVYFVENNSEDIVKIEILELGIKVSGTFYSFSNINSFGIVYRGENAKFLRLYLNKKGLNKIDLLIDNSIVSDVTEILSPIIEENPKIEVTFSEKLIEILKL